MDDVDQEVASTVDFDVIVVGSGMAGMSAALEASDYGANVLLVEGDTVLGGNSRFSSGIMMATGTSLQRANGLDDHPDDLFQDYLLANHWDVKPSVVRRLADELPGTFEWIHGLGVEFAEQLIPSGEERVPRGHAAVGKGHDIIAVLTRHLRSRPNVDIVLNRRVDRLVVEAGRVRGVAVGDDVVRATTVVLATGGFAGNPDLFERYLPLAAANDKAWYITDEISPTAGDIFRLVEPVDAYIEGVDRGGWVLCTDFDRERQAYMPGWLVVVNTSGRRFMDEMSPYSVVDPLVRAQGNRVFAIFDDAAKRASNPSSIRAATKVNLNVSRSHFLEEVIDQQIGTGKVQVGDTVEDLAEKLGIPPANLTGTLDRYNEDAHRKHDSLFLKNGEQMRPLEQAPFYGCEMRLSLIALTACGPAIDAEARVLRGGQQPVPGLFAAGECAGGVIGKIYIGSGNSIANCLAYGRIAGRNAAAARHRTVPSDAGPEVPSATATA
ncbi:FAD-dependent oxidoreductase [Spirillospora sp. CA-255316]